jgi:hypothetical protein
MVPLLEGRRRAERRGACSATGALRGFQLGDLLAIGRSGRIFNDQDRCLVCVVVSDVDHAKASSPQWDRVASAPRRHRRTERGRVGRCSVLELEPVDEASHSVLPFIGWDRTPGSAYRRGRRINFGASAPQTAAPVWSPALAPRLQTRPPALRLRPRRRTPPRRSPGNRPRSRRGQRIEATSARPEAGAGRTRCRSARQRGFAGQRGSDCPLYRCVLGAALSEPQFSKAVSSAPARCPACRRHGP